MNATTKKLLIVSILITIIVGVIITGIASFASGDVRETVNDANKTSAIIDDEYKLAYVTRDLAKYNNLYCIQHSQSLDRVLAEEYNNEIDFSADKMVDIVGNIATFYERDGDEWKQVGEPVNNIHNNIFAGILTEEKTDDVFTADEWKKVIENYNNTYNQNKTYNPDNHRIYKGYGAMVELGGNLFSVTYTFSQVSLWIEWNNWIDGTGATSYGFNKDSANSYNNDTWGKVAATQYIEEIKKEINLGKNYNAKIYNLSTGLENIQDLIVVEPTMNIPVTKIWDDSTDTSNRTPVTVKLLANNQDTGKKLTLNSDNNWKGTFTNLNKNHTYAIQELGVPGYCSEINGDNDIGYAIFNTLITTNVTVEKYWNDVDNIEGLRPTSIEVALYENGTKTNKLAVLNEDNEWYYEFTGLPKYKNGKEVTYTVEETNKPEGYESEISQPTENTENEYITIKEFKITNTRIPEKSEIKVTKVWNDEDNLDDLRPTSITVTLCKNGTETNQTLTLNEGNNWTGTFKDLYKYQNGRLVNYTVKETGVPTGYTSEITGNMTTGYTITNTHIPHYDGYIEIQGKVWLDGVGGKANEINGQFKDGEKGLGGIKVVLRDSTGQQFDATSTATTDVNGNYTIKVNYDNSSNVYKLYENSDTVYEKLQTAYVEFEYNAMKYTTVATATEEENTSKAKENEEARNSFDSKYQTVTPSTDVTKIDVGNTVTTWKDLSGNRDGNINGAIFESNYLLFDGINDWVNAGQVTLNNEVSLEAMIEINSIQPGEVHIIGNFENGGAGLILNNGVPVSSVYIDGVGYVEASGSEALQVDRKYHIAGTYDGKSVKLYINGELIKETKTSGKIGAPQKNTIMSIGANPSGDIPLSYWIKAKIYDAKVYNKALTQSEINQNISGSDIVSGGLIRHYSVKNNVNITASTKDVISFETYKDETIESRTEVIKYCNGNGTYSHTNPSGAWNSIITKNHSCANCTGKGHSMRTYDVTAVVIKNVNLGLFEREQPDVAIFSDISKVKVTMQGQEYTYLYNVRSNEKNNVGLKVKFENKDTYTYQRPVNPADIAYINQVNKDLMSVAVTYEVSLANLSTTLPVTIHNITTYFDNRYTLTTTGWTQNAGTEFSTATNSAGLNVTLNPGSESEKIELTYLVSLEAIRNLLNEDATLNHAVEIESYSTKYGVNTLYAEQRTGGRNNQPYAGYDSDSHPGNAGIHIDDQGRLAATNIEDDTDIAPSFVLCKDENYYKVLSGNVWEDSDANSEDGYRLGDGKKSDTDKNVENVKVELFKIRDDGTLETAKLYYLNTDTAEVKTKDAITYTDSNGNYAFGDENYSVVTDKYVIKFTYGDGIDSSKTSTINGSTVNARDYKSTIISQDNINVYDLFKGTNTSDEWHLNTSKGYSIAVDTIEERTAISDLQYSNFGDQLNITAWSKPFTMQIEFDPSVEKSTTVEADGITIFENKLDIFDFGIIERAREDIFVETSVEYLKITLANGQVLTEGDPRVDELNYAKPIGFKQNIDSGIAARNAIEKQVLIELDTELMQGAQLEVKYSIEVTNNSEKDIDIDEDEDGQYKTEFYYFGTNNEGALEVNTSINYVVDYLDSELTYTWENSDDWTQKSADELLAEGLISEATYNAIKESDYAAYITTKFSNLKPGESMTDHVSAKKLLANQEENVYDNHAEILKIDAKTARTIKQTGTSKEYKMGNYVPSLAARKINTDVNVEKAGLHEQDDDRLKIVITPPTGTTMYIITYIVTGLIGLIVIAIVIIFIKKKVLTK